jgi:hypothetical protein
LLFRLGRSQCCLSPCRATPHSFAPPSHACCRCLLL